VNMSYSSSGTNLSDHQINLTNSRIQRAFQETKDANRKHLDDYSNYFENGENIQDNQNNCQKSELLEEELDDM